MQPFKDMPTQSQRNLSIATLFDYLLGLLEIKTATGKSAEKLMRFGINDNFVGLMELGKHLGLNMNQVSLKPSTAAEASSTQTPLIARFADGQCWLVLSGFSRGKIRATIIHREIIEQRRINPSAVAKLMAWPEEQFGDWLLVQAKAPLENAVSQDHHAHIPPFQRLIALLRADKSDLGLVLGLALGSGLLALASPVAVQALVNSVAMGGMGQPLIVLSIILFFFLAFAGGVQVLESYLVEIVQRRIFVRLAVDMAHRLPKVRRQVYDKYNGVELVNRFFDVLTLQKAGSLLLLDGLSTAVQTLVGLIMLAFYHPFLLAFDVVLLLSIFCIIFLLGRGSVSTAIKESIAKYDLVAWLESVAGNIHIFKFGGGSELATGKINNLALSYLEAKRSHYRVLLRQVIGSVTLYAVASTALLAIGGFLVIDGHLTLGQLVAAELIVSSALISLIKFGKHLEGFYDLMSATDKIGHLLDLPLESDQGEQALADGAVSVEVKDLCFAYSNKRPIFNQLNLLVKPSEKVALLANYSTGKTTLVELLTGMRHPDNGQIKINGIALNGLHLESLRQRVAVVSLPEFIPSSIFENVRLGRSHLEHAHVESALAKLEVLDDFTEHFEDGLDTLINANGSPLSSSQARLLLLARAIAGSPNLLIIDGVLDGMDERHRQVVMRSLLADDMPWTLLVLTSLPQVAALCQRAITLPERHSHV